MKNTFVLFTLFFSVFSVSAEKVAFDFAYLPDKTYAFAQEVDVDMKMPNPLGAGDMMNTITELGMDTKLVTSEHEKGLKVVMSFDKMVMDTKMNGVSMLTYDSSAEDAEANPVSGMLKPLTEIEVTSYFSKEGDFLEMEEIKEQAALKLAGFSADQFEQMVDPSMMLPKEPVEIGETWVAEQSFPLGSLSQESMSISLNCKFEGVEDLDGIECAKVSYSSDLDLEFTEGGQTLRIKSNTFKGSYWHDNSLKFTRKTTLYADMVLSPPVGTEVEEGGLGEIPYKMRTEVKLLEVK